MNTYYSNWIKDSTKLIFVNNLTAAHTQPTDDSVNTNACTLSTSPYISYCAYDGSGQALNHIYPGLSPRNDGVLAGTLLQFDQTEFITGQSMDTTGYAFVPASCAAMAPCKLHVSFHGCQQSASTVGTAYVKNTGFNKWADNNRLIVLYPQTKSSQVSPSNPNGCWDWWGYNNANYDTQKGSQMDAVFAMMTRVASGKPAIPPPRWPVPRIRRLHWCGRRPRGNWLQLAELKARRRSKEQQCWRSQ